MQVWLPSPQATWTLGYRLAGCLPSGTVLRLSGPLGSGKTTLVQGLAAGLGIADDVVSPTFTLAQEFPEGRLPLYHLDLYRLEPDEVEALHPELYWQEMPAGLVAIEWPERLRTPPPDGMTVILEMIDRGRRATLTGPAVLACLTSLDGLTGPQSQGNT